MPDSPEDAQLDAVVVGAGFAGLYALYRLRGIGLRVRVIDAADGVGGTWYWNRYPGARCDVPSIEYSFSFSDELQDEWSWSEWMAPQPELLAYANHVADRFDLRRDIQLGTRVTSASFDEATSRWSIETDAGERLVAKYCVMATGCLSIPNFPEIKDSEKFSGPTYHTGLWPQEGVDLAGRRVGLIGTGSSGVQSIPEIAKQAEHLLVFQRTPVFTFPAHNRPLDREFLDQVKASYDQIRSVQRQSLAGVAGWSPRALAKAKEAKARRSGPRKIFRILEATDAEKQAALDRFGFAAAAAYADVRTDPEANEAACELYRDRLREVIDDPAVAEGLSPRGYPIGCKRQVFDTDYYQTFNRSDVTLVDLRQGEIEEIVPTGLRTEHAEYEFDVLVYATGFDAMTGALMRIDILGREGQALRDRWADGPRAYLGLQVAGFPNLFTITGPGSPSVLSNMLVSIEQHVDWIADCITHLEKNGLVQIEPTPEAEDAWLEHVNEVAEGTMFTAPSCNSWYLGASIRGKPRIFMPYVGGVGRYRQKCDEVAAAGYTGFALR